MMPFNDLTGRIFGRLRVLELHHIDWHRASYYWCECECGVVKVVQRSNLISGGTVSCGCWRIAQSRERFGEKSPVYRHGRRVRGTDNHEYEAWKWQQTLKRREERLTPA
jgi:hypothetical protein